MKGLFRTTLIAVAVLLFSNFTFAQTPKFGYIQSAELMALMPEVDSVKNKMEAFNAELSKQFEEMQVEFNRKFEAYTKGAETMTPAVRETKEKELQQIRARLEEFNRSAQSDMNQQYATLMAPIIEKAKQAIQKVAKANNITMVFDMSSAANQIIYHDAATVVDMLPLVKAELNLKSKPATAVK